MRLAGNSTPTTNGGRRFGRLGFVTTLSLLAAALPMVMTPQVALAAPVNSVNPTWAQPTSPTQTFTSVASDDSTWVAVSQSGTNRVLRSTDGTTWTEVPGQTSNWVSVTAGPSNTFVAIAGAAAQLTSQVMRSTDGGLTWTMGEYTGQGNLLPGADVAYGNGTFVTVGFQGTADYYTSATGAPGDWTGRVFTQAGNRLIAFGDDTFVALDGNDVELSNNGTTWSPRIALPTTGSWASLSYGNGTFVIIEGSGTKALVSTDGVNWTQGTLPSGPTWTSVTASSGLYVASGNQFGTERKIATSLDGVTWALADNSAAARPVSALASSAGRFVGVGTGGVITSRPPILLTGPTPSVGLVTGGTSITFAGNNLDQVNAVTLGGTNVTIGAQSPTSLTVTTPARTAGTVTANLQSAADGSTRRTDAFTYYDVPAPGVVLPHNGPTSGGTEVTILGSGFAGVTSVTFGGVAGTGLAVSGGGTVITVTSPAQAAGTVDLVVNNPATSETISSIFTYQAPVAGPVVNSISPVTGPVAGGGTLVLIGTGLGSATSVTIDGVAATITSNTATSIQVTIPAGTAGQVDVAVTVGGVTYTAVNGYLYTGTPSITAVTPASGLASGGTTVTITGTGYLGGSTAVTFGGIAGIITATTANTVTAVTPAYSSGSLTVNVGLSTLGGSTSASNAFTYLRADVTSLTPANGPDTGSPVTLIGSALSGATSITFDGVAGTNIRANTATSVTVDAPAHAAGPVDVIFTGAAGTFTYDVANYGGYTYVATGAGPYVSSISPSSGTWQGGTTVTITGGNLAGVNSVVLDDGFTSLALTGVTAVSPTQVTAVTPPFGGGFNINQSYNIVVSDGSSPWTVSSAFAFTDTVPALTAITPAQGTYQGDTLAILSGANLTQSGDGAVEVVFDSTPVDDTDIVSASDTEITFLVPTTYAGFNPGLFPAPISVDVVHPDTGTSTAIGSIPSVPITTQTYTLVADPAPTISSVSPSSGSPAGGTSVTITGTNLTGSTAVTFGGTSATSFAVNSATSITATAPAGSGTVSVAVTAPGGTVSSPSAFTYIAAPPGTPGTPSAVAGNAQATVTIAAPGSGGSPTSYTVTSSPGNRTCTVTVPATSCIVTGLTNGTAYAFTSTATNSAGTSSASAASNSVTPIAPPGTPGTPTAVVTSSTSATVTPTPPSSGGPVANYTVTASPGGAACTVTSPATSCVVTGLTSGQSYTFTTTATNSSGTSSASGASGSVTLSAPGTPGTPTAVAGPGNATVSVTPGSGGTPSSFAVASSPAGGTCTVTPPATSCIVAGLTPGTSYTFTATATNGIGTSGSSAASNAVTPTANVAPGTPGTPSAVAGNAQATVTIVAPGTGGSPTSYTVTSAPGGLTCTVTVPAASCIVSGLTNGTTYTFTSTATNAAGTSGVSAASASVTPLAPPGTPGQPLATVASSTSVTVTPTPPTSGGPVASYTVTASPGGATCTVTAPTTSCAVTGLTNGQTYTFTTTATNVGGTSGSSSASSAVTLSAPGIPAAPLAVAGAGSATVSVTPGSGGAPSTYTVTSSPSGGTCTVTVPASSCTVTGLTPGTAYTFTATATNGIGTSGASPASNSVTPTSPTPPTPPTPTPPSAPTSVTAAAGPRSIAVSWGPPATAGSFPVTSYRVVATPGGATCTATAPATTCTLTGLTNGTAYTVSVSALSGAGWGASASVGPVTPGVTPPGTPPTPTALAANGQATVIVTPPTTGGPVSSYLVTSSPGGYTCTVVVPATSCVVGNLSNGTAYTFSAVATNAGGTSLSSSASAPVTPASPITPGPVTPTVPPVPGGSQYYVNGSPAKGLVVAPNSRSDGLKISDDDFRMDLSGQSVTGGNLPLGPTGQLVLLSGATAITEGEGFRPQTEVSLYLSRNSSETQRRVARLGAPLLVGAVGVNNNGTFSGVVDLPTGLAPGDYTLEAVGVTVSNDARAIVLGITVETPSESITLIKGKRTADGRHDRVRTTGLTSGIPAGALLIPYIRYGTNGSFTAGKASITVQADGSFRWSRLIRKDRPLVAYVAFADTMSNTVAWKRIR